MNEHASVSDLPPLAHYDAACRELAAASSIDEVEAVRSKAVALKLYAKQRRDALLMESSTAIVARAKRRLGEVMAEMREAGELPEGRPKKRDGNGPVLPTLADAGIDKHLADEARKAAAMPAAEYEAAIARAVTIAVATINGEKSVLQAARLRRHTERQARRAAREKTLAEKIAALPSKRFGVILADPEWKFETYSEKGLTYGSADNHYPTSPLEEIKARDVASIAAQDCVLFLWATVPFLAGALEVMAAWGFRYVTNFVWLKPNLAQGYWNRNRHEHLLVGVKGAPPAPAQGKDLKASVIEAPTRGHSVKPLEAYEMIEAYFPHLPKIELNARAARDGWSRWGLEAPA